MHNYTIQVMFAPKSIDNRQIDTFSLIEQFTTNQSICLLLHFRINTKEVIRRMNPAEAVVARAIHHQIQKGEHSQFTGFSTPLTLYHLVFSESNSGSGSSSSSSESDNEQTRNNTTNNTSKSSTKSDEDDDEKNTNRTGNSTPEGTDEDTRTGALTSASNNNNASHYHNTRASDDSDDDQDSDAISNKSYDQLSSSKSSIDVNICSHSISVLNESHT